MYLRPDDALRFINGFPRGHLASSRSSGPHLCAPVTPSLSLTRLFFFFSPPRYPDVLKNAGGVGGCAVRTGKLSIRCMAMQASGPHEPPSSRTRPPRVALTLVSHRDRGSCVVHFCPLHGCPSARVRNQSRDRDRELEKETRRGGKRLAFGVWRLAFGIWHLAFGIWQFSSGFETSCANTKLTMLACTRLSFLAWRGPSKLNWGREGRRELRAAERGRICRRTAMCENWRYGSDHVCWRTSRGWRQCGVSLDRDHDKKKDYPLTVGIYSAAYRDLRNTRILWR